MEIPKAKYEIGQFVYMTDANLNDESNIMATHSYFFVYGNICGIEYNDDGYSYKIKIIQNKHSHRNKDIFYCKENQIITSPEDVIHILERSAIAYEDEIKKMRIKQLNIIRKELGLEKKDKYAN